MGHSHFGLLPAPYRTFRPALGKVSFRRDAVTEQFK